MAKILRCQPESLIKQRELLNVSEGWLHFYPATQIIDRFYVMAVDRQAEVPPPLKIQPKNTVKARASARTPGSDEWWTRHALFYRHSVSFKELTEARRAAKRLRKAADTDSEE